MRKEVKHKNETQIMEGKKYEDILKTLDVVTCVEVVKDCNDSKGDLGE